MSNSFKDWYITDVPRTLDEVYGQDLIVKSLREDFKKRSFSKSTLYMGDFGSGKTVLAKIQAKALVCKTPNPDGSGCCKCPSCLAIENEQWNRDVVYINAENASAQDVREIVDRNLLTSAIRDASKVFLIEEAQALSAQGVEAFLIATQSPLQNTFFIFTAMEKLKGAKAGALESRCKKWKMKVPVPSEIYMYLAKFAQKKGLTADKDIPVSFWKDGLKLLSENSEQSFRKAIQLLQQCYDARIFEVDSIKTLFDFNAEEDAAQFLAELSNGQITNNTLNIMMGNEYIEKFNLLLNILGDAKIYKLFGKIYENEEEKWREKQPAIVAKGPYFDLLCDTFLNLSKSTYLKKGDFKLLIGQVVEAIQNKSNGVHPIEIQEQTLNSGGKVVARRTVVKNA
jgi:DNA polymerase-3 subunit gamma/tau